MKPNENLPVAVIGAGPVGLAAAAQLIRRGLRPLIFESGPSVGTALRAWGHVRVFSPWRYVIEHAAAELLYATGWSAPDDDMLPTGFEIVERYLEPLSRAPEIASNILFNAKVGAITRQGLDKVTSQGRDTTPFQIRYTDKAGTERSAVARAVLDASGTWSRHSPMGVDGLPVVGEGDARDRIAYGIPDVSGRDKTDYAGRSVLVVGSGHSAINVVLSLLDLKAAAPATTVLWALRRNRIERLLGGGLNDQLPARGDLGLAATAAIEGGRVKLLAPFFAQTIRTTAGGLEVDALVAGQSAQIAVDRIVVATGLRPDLDMLNEIRLDLDPAVEAPRKLAPMIDPNLHSCGTVPPHGVVELAQPEHDFFIVGGKSYGRAPTFLMATGYEQVRSVVAELAGDHKAAREVHLVLPETGVCNVSSSPSKSASVDGCCGDPVPANVDPGPVTGVEGREAGKSCCGSMVPKQSQRAAAE